MTAELPRIGIVGLGRMGANLARRLAERRFSIAAVFDLNEDTARVLAQELHSQAPSTLARVAELSDVVLTVVSDDRAMRTIFSATAKDSLLKGPEGKTFINCATVTPQVHVEVEALAEKHSCRSLEACMAGSITQARQGTIYLMCGGKREVFDAIKPIFEAISTNCRYIGPAGQAAKVKALVNMVMNINTAGLAEGLGLGAALGLDLGMLREVFSQTGANSRVLETDGADMQNREHDCYFSAAHAAKDSGIALALAKKAKLKLPLASATFGQYSLMTTLGLGDIDKSGISELTFPGRWPKKKAKT